MELGSAHTIVITHNTLARIRRRRDITARDRIRFWRIRTLPVLAHAAVEESIPYAVILAHYTLTRVSRRHVTAVRVEKIDIIITQTRDAMTVGVGYGPFTMIRVASHAKTRISDARRMIRLCLVITSTTGTHTIIEPGGAVAMIITRHALTRIYRRDVTTGYNFRL